MPPRHAAAVPSLRHASARAPGLPGLLVGRLGASLRLVGLIVRAPLRLPDAIARGPLGLPDAHLGMAESRVENPADLLPVSVRTPGGALPGSGPPRRGGPPTRGRVAPGPRRTAAGGSASRRGKESGAPTGGPRPPSGRRRPARRRRATVSRKGSSECSNRARVPARHSKSDEDSVERPAGAAPPDPAAPSAGGNGNPREGAESAGEIAAGGADGREGSPG